MLPLYLSLQGGNTLAKLSQLSIHAHIAFLPFLCAGCAWLIATKPVIRITGTFLVLLGFSPFFLGTEFFKNEVASEILVAQNTTSPEWKTVEATETRSRSLEDDHWGLQLSPNGLWFTTQTDDHHYHIHTWESTVSDLEAHALTWTDKSDCLALVKNAGGLELIRFSPENPDSKTMHHRLEYADYDDHFDLRSEGNNWQILAGKGSSSSTLLVGSFSNDSVTRKSWHNNTFEDSWRHVSNEGRLLELSWNPKKDGENAQPFQKFHQFYYWPTYLQFIDSENQVVNLGTSHLWVTGNSDFQGNARVLSQADHAAYLWTLGNANAPLIPIAQLPAVKSWWIQSDQLVLLAEQAIHISDLNGTSGARILLSDTSTWEDELALQGNKLAALRHRDGKETVVLHELPTDSLYRGTLLASLEEESE